MEVHPIVWGLDIGHTSIKAVRLSRNGDNVSVLGYAIEPIPTDESVDRDEAVVTALQGLSQREEMGNTPVVCSLSGRQIFARTVNIPIINPKKVHKMVELEARQQIPGNFNEVMWDYHLSPSLDGASYDVAIFAARNEIIDDLIVKCRKANLNLIGISVTSLAVYNYVQYDQDFQEDEAVIVLDVGAENTDLVVYKGDTLWMRNLGISGNDITRAFMKKFRVSFEEAETLKCQVGESRQAEKIFKVIEGSLGELVSDVQRSLGFYKSQNPDAEFESTVVSGNTFKLPNLTQYMADRLGYAIITLVEMERIQVDAGLEREHFLEDLQTLGTSMGLALQGVGVGKASVNLLPSNLRIQGILKAKRWAAIAILAILPLAWLATYMVQQKRLEYNVDLMGRIQTVVKENQDGEKKAKEMLKQVEGPTKAAAPYATYAKHVGVMRALETQIFQVIQGIATDPDLLPPLPEGQDRTLRPSQAIYLESLTIPNVNATGVASFNPMEAERKIILEVRIRDEFFDEASSRLRNGLNKIAATPAMWRVANPTKPPNEMPEELPTLFSRVDTDSKAPVQETWYYIDLNAQDAKGNLLSEAQATETRRESMSKLRLLATVKKASELKWESP